MADLLAEIAEESAERGEVERLQELMAERGWTGWSRNRKSSRPLLTTGIASREKVD